MIRKITVLALSAVLTASLWTPAAFAGDDWFFGGGFEIGGIHFRIGLHGDRHDRHFYRTRIDLGRHYHSRARCSRSCYRDGGYYYHAKSCPLVHGFFRHHGFHADHVFARFSPRFHGHGRHYDRHYEYRDRHYRDRHYRGHGHYRDHGYRRDHGRYRGHGRHRGHGHHRRGHRHSRHCPYH